MKKTLVKRGGIRLLLLDVGNTHTHVGWSSGGRVIRRADFPTSWWQGRKAGAFLADWVGGGEGELVGAAFCSVVPWCNPGIVRFLGRRWGVSPLVLDATTLVGVGVRYPRPETIGADRLANAVAARHLWGGPVVVVDFGTAVTFDVVDRAGDYVGGIIAPGLNAMTDYLHEKTALLPRIQIRDPKGAIGKSTEHAMLIGAVHGYRALVRGLIAELRKELEAPRLRVVATGGYAALMARGVPEISRVVPELTLDGLRIAWQGRVGGG